MNTDSLLDEILVKDGICRVCGSDDYAGKDWKPGNDAKADLITYCHKQVIEAREEQVMQDFLSLTMSTFKGLEIDEQDLIAWRTDRIAELRKTL